MGLTLFEESYPIVHGGVVVAADGTNAITVGPALAQPWRCDALFLTSDDTISHAVNICVLISPYVYFIGTVAVPAGAGFGVVPPVEAVALLGPASIAGWLFTPLASLALRMEVAVVATKHVNSLLYGGYI